MATDNIILEHLRAIRGDMTDLKGTVREILEQLVSLRLRDHAQDNDIHSHNRRLAQIEADVERIKRRLELAD